MRKRWRRGTTLTSKALALICTAFMIWGAGPQAVADDGAISFDEKFKADGLPPCVVYAECTDNTGEILVGPSLSVIDKQTGEPIENRAGQPVNLADYPGGTYNVFHATAGNKVLVAWPSRFRNQNRTITRA